MLGIALSITMAIAIVIDLIDSNRSNRYRAEYRTVQDVQLHCVTVHNVNIATLFGYSRMLFSKRRAFITALFVNSN